MFAIAFDLDCAVTRATHPKSLTQAYSDIAATLSPFGFRWKQGSLYLAEDESLANLADAMQALKAMKWFPASVRDIRAFRVENWSDFTASIKKR